MKIFIVILFSGMILFSGCSQSDSEKTATEPNQEVITFAPPDTISDSVKNITTSESNVPTTAVSTEPSDKLNPPHGEPGHRCDIPVGSPLNSPPGNTSSGNTQGINPAPSIVTPGNSTTPVKTAPGMNPPHGEAGHDCAIPVGDPLKK